MGKPVVNILVGIIITGLGMAWYLVEVPVIGPIVRAGGLVPFWRSFWWYLPPVSGDCSSQSAPSSRGWAMMITKTSKEVAEYGSSNGRTADLYTKGGD